MKKFLEECKIAYYSGNPIISDSEFDMLESICDEDLSIGTNKGRVKHFYKMYSLQKYYLDDEHKFDKNIYVKTPKLDGASLSLRYFKGKLNSVITRGNGEYGEDVSHLFSRIVCDKLDIPFSIQHYGIIQITGEVVAPKNIKNSRNYAAGALNLKSELEFLEKSLVFFSYNIQPSPMQSYDGSLHYLHKLRFNTVLKSQYPAIINDYPQDGVVYRLVDNIEYEAVGFTSKHPRGAFAIKKRSEGVITKILDVIWQTGKSGKVTPVATLEPINIDGANVSKVTLNNAGFIEALNLHIGDSVYVERAGGIIPRIIKKAE